MPTLKASIRKMSPQDIKLGTTSTCVLATHRPEIPETCKYSLSGMVSGESNADSSVLWWEQPAGHGVRVEHSDSEELGHYLAPWPYSRACIQVGSSTQHQAQGQGLHSPGQSWPGSGGQAAWKESIFTIFTATAWATSGWSTPGPPDLPEDPAHPPPTSSL